MYLIYDLLKGIFQEKSFIRKYFVKILEKKIFFSETFLFCVKLEVINYWKQVL